MPSVVSTGGKIYAVSDKGILSCIDAATGELLNRRRVSGNYSATPLLAGGNLYLSSRDGNVWVVKCDESLEDVGNYKFDAQLMATPTTIGNDLLIRTAKKLYRIGNKKG
jgi:outer membrane protein assembly factor BamB